MFKKYIDYLKDNPNGYWFKRKLYGWGWTPAKWQGWFVSVLYIFIILLLALTANKNSSFSQILFTFIIPIALLTIVLFWIIYKKGEKPRW